MTIPDELAEAARMKMDISPSTGEQSQKIADGIVNASPEVVARARELFGDLVRWTDWEQ